MLNNPLNSSDLVQIYVSITRIFRYINEHYTPKITNPDIEVPHRSIQIRERSFTSGERGWRILRKNSGALLFLLKNIP